MVCSYSEKSKRGGGMLNGLAATYALAVIVLCWNGFYFSHGFVSDEYGVFYAVGSILAAL